eukprot:UN03071
MSLFLKNLRRGLCFAKILGINFPQTTVRKKKDSKELPNVWS